MSDAPQSAQSLEQLQSFCLLILGKLDGNDNVLTHYQSVLLQYRHARFDQQQMDYVLNHFLLQSCTKLMQRNYSNDARDFNLADTVSTCCRELVTIAASLLSTTHAEIAIMILFHTLNSNCSFHRTFGHDWRQRHGECLSTAETKQLAKWRSTLMAGAHVDYLMCNRWRHGFIHAVEDKEEVSGKHRVLHIQPQMNGMYPSHKIGGYQRRKVPALTDDDDDADNDNVYTEQFTLSEQTLDQIALPLSKSIELQPFMKQWRKALRSGSESTAQCDCLDTVHKWYTCTVREEDEAANMIHVNYDGWSHRYDEWVEKTELRMQPFMSQAKGGRHTQGVTGTLDDIGLCAEDEEDTEDEAVFALWRGKLDSIDSFHIVDLLNEFGKCNGFEAVLRQVKSEKPSISITLVARLLSAFGTCSKAYTRRFAKQFIKPLIASVFDLFAELNETDLAALTPELFNAICGSLRKLLERDQKEGPQIEEKLGKLMLDVALKQLHCVSLRRRIDAAQCIARVCTSSYGAAYMWLTSQYLAHWIEENDILSSLCGLSEARLHHNTLLIEGYIRSAYGGHDYLPFDVMRMVKLWYNEQSHPLVMQNAKQVLNFLAQSDNLHTSHIETVWSILHRLTVEHKLQNKTLGAQDTKQKHTADPGPKKKHGNDDDKDDDDDDDEEDEEDEEDNDPLSAMCYVVASLMDVLSDEHITFLIENIVQLDVSLITFYHLKVVSFASKKFNQTQNAEKCLTFLWNLVQSHATNTVDDDNEHRKELVNNAMILLSMDLGSTAGEQIRSEFMQNCIYNLKEHKSVCHSLRLLQTLLKIMPSEQRFVHLDHLMCNEKLLTLFVNDVVHFKATAKQQLISRGLMIVPSTNDDDIAVKNGVNCQINASSIEDAGGAHFEYLKAIKERIYFLRFLFKSYKDMKLTEQHANVLYAEFVRTGITLEERKLAIVRLKDYLLSGDDDMQNKYPLLSTVGFLDHVYVSDEDDASDDEDEEDEDEDDDEAWEIASADQGVNAQQRQQNIEQAARNTGIDPQVLMALGYDGSDDIDPNVLQSLMANQDEILQSFQNT